MVRIAICDDEESATLQEESIAREALRRLKIPCETRLYTRADNLLADIEDDSLFFDIFLLDIEMPEISGMDLPDRIHRSLPDSKIIFVTSHLEYAVDAFELSVFRYVPKATLSPKLERAVADAAKLAQLQEGNELIIHTSQHLEKIPYKDILYIQKGGKNCIFVLKDRQTKARMSLEQVSLTLPSADFLFIDRGILVNMANIVRMEGDTVVLVDGTVLPLSHRRLREIRQCIAHFWGMHL